MKFNKLKKFDWTLFIIPLLLLSIGVIALYSITYSQKQNLAYDQIVYALIGIGVMLFFTYLDYRSLKGVSPILYFFGLIFLILVFFIGTSQFGATRWIKIGPFDFQPSELFKLILILTMARFYANRIDDFRLRHLVGAGLYFLIPFLLVLKQPDLGTASVIFICFIAITFVSKMANKLKVIVISLILIAAPIAWLTLKDYQKERIEVFLSPSKDPKGSGYNVTQSIIAVGSGGLTGEGLGKGSQGQLNFLPVVHTDFIFAGLAEMTGFIGTSIVLLLYLILVIRAFNVAAVAKDNFGMFVAIGISFYFIFEVFVNVGMNIGIMPVTGIPLPLISHGGTSLVTTMAMLGILQSIYSRHQDLSFSN